MGPSGRNATARDLFRGSLKITKRAYADLARIFEFTAEHYQAFSLAAVERIRTAVEILSEHPLIGRRIELGMRELVISRGKSGYVALYRFLPQEQVLAILAIRHQRESGYAEE